MFQSLPTNSTNRITEKLPNEPWFWRVYCSQYWLMNSVTFLLRIKMYLSATVGDFCLCWANIKIFICMTPFQRTQNIWVCSQCQYINIVTIIFVWSGKKRECPILLRHYLCHSSKINKLLLNFFIYSLSHKIQETLPKACRDKTRGNGFKQKEGWFRLGIRKKLFLQEWWGSGSGCPEDL